MTLRTTRRGQAVRVYHWRGHTYVLRSRPQAVPAPKRATSSYVATDLRPALPEHLPAASNADIWRHILAAVLLGTVVVLAAASLASWGIWQ